jgi:hypothetical protein
MQRSRCPGKRVPGLALGTDDVPVPAPDNGPADSAVDAVRLALMAVSRKRPGGKVAEADELTGPAQWTAWTITAVLPCCRAAVLPGLIRDLHATMDAGQDLPELLKLAAMVPPKPFRAGYWCGSAAGSALQAVFFTAKGTVRRGSRSDPRSREEGRSARRPDRSG